MWAAASRVLSQFAAVDSLGPDPGMSNQTSTRHTQGAKPRVSVAIGLDHHVAQRGSLTRARPADLGRPAVGDGARRRGRERLPPTPQRDYTAGLEWLRGRFRRAPPRAPNTGRGGPRGATADVQELQTGLQAVEERMSLRQGATDHSSVDAGACTPKCSSSRSPCGRHVRQPHPRPGWRATPSSAASQIRPNPDGRLRAAVIKITPTVWRSMP
jgi:hypothetical protein